MPTAHALQPPQVPQIISQVTTPFSPTSTSRASQSSLSPHGQPQQSAQSLLVTELRQQADASAAQIPYLCPIQVCVARKRRVSSSSAHLHVPSKQTLLAGSHYSGWGLC